jgi:adenylate cyclase
MSKKLPIFIGFLILGLFVWLSLTSYSPVRYVLTRLNNIFYDIELRMHLWVHPKLAQGQVVIIDVDDLSLKELGRWPWPRSLLGKLVDQLKQQGVVVVATDMMFSEADVNVVSTVLNSLTTKNLATPELITALNQISPDFEQDGLFANSLRGMDSVLGMVLLPSKQQQGVLPPPLLTLTPQQSKELSILKAWGYISNVSVLESAVKSAGFLNVFPDGDGVIRRAPLLMRYQDEVYPSLALEAARRYLLINQVSLETPYYGSTVRLEGIKLGRLFIPTDEKGQALVPFIGRSFTFPYYSAVNVLRGKIPENALQGKLAFIGTSATGEGDIKATAVEKVFPGVEIQASLANGILTQYFPYTPPWAKGAELVFTVVIGILGALIFPYLGPIMVSALMVSIPIFFVGFLFLEEWVWHKTGFIVSTLIPTALIVVLAIFNIIYGYLFEARKRKQLKGMFGQYVPKKHIDAMLKAKGNFGMLGDDREMTVLFADIRGFTSISEGMKAPELKEMLNFFFTPMTELIFDHKGTIDKYVGDLIMAFWGAPMKDKSHAHNALAAALEMHEKINKMAPELASHGWPRIDMGIGLNSGIMSVGDMGSKFRRNYTVLGDEVNLASRVESLTKYYGVHIMTTEHTQANQKGFIFRQLDRVRVKGKQEGINIFEVVNKAKNLTPDLQQELEEHHRALSCYFEGRFDEANEVFTKLHDIYPDTKIYKLYMERLATFKETPPPPDWGGIYTHTSK